MSFSFARMNISTKYRVIFSLCVVLTATAAYQPVNQGAIQESMKHVVTAARELDPEMLARPLPTKQFILNPTATPAFSRKLDGEHYHISIDVSEDVNSTPSITPAPLVDEQHSVSGRISPTKTPRPLRTGHTMDNETPVASALASQEPWGLFEIRATPTVSADAEWTGAEETRTPVSGADLPLTSPMLETPEAPPTPTAKPHSAVKESPKESKKGACFPGSAEVELLSGNKKRMDKVVVGDMVHVGAGMFSRVFMFTHKIPVVKSPFAKLVLSTGHTIELTPGHYLYLNGRLAMAKSAKLGDMAIIGNGTAATITSVSRISKSGLYNPQTLHGNIVVNGVLASTYTEAVAPNAAHALLSPLRALFGFLKVTFRLFETNGHFLANILPSGAEFLA